MCSNAVPLSGWVPHDAVAVFVAPCLEPLPAVLRPRALASCIEAAIVLGRQKTASGVFADLSGAQVVLDQIDATLAAREAMLDRLPKLIARHAARHVADLDASTGDAARATDFLRDAMRADSLPHGLPLTHTPGDIDQWARRMADHATTRVRRGGGVADLLRLCERANVVAPRASDAGIIGRLEDAQWWARRARRLALQGIEAVAIRSGAVGASAAKCISDWSHFRLSHQDDANKVIALATDLTNIETGEVMALDSIIALGMGNPANRRAELMTRVRGVEEQAERQRMVPLFVTATLPSRFHVSATVGNASVRNPKYAGEPPREGQRLLQAQWRRFRARCAKLGIGLAGLRVAEAHADSTAHWHVVIFARADHVSTVTDLLHTYFREADGLDGDERGAARNRVKVIRLEGRQAATRYVVKYIQKSVGAPEMIDGQPVSGAVLRQSHWHRVHGIRQFSFFGAGAIGVWRELRRIAQAATHDAPDLVREAWSAAQRDGERRADYAKYLQLMGGLPVSDPPVRLATRDEPGGRYGEPVRRPVGVACGGVVVSSCRERWERQPVRRDRLEAAREVVAERCAASTATRYSTARASGRPGSRSRLFKCNHGAGPETGQSRPVHEFGRHATPPPGPVEVCS